jgi:hypothetical protein
MNPLWILASLFGFLQDRQTQEGRNEEAAGREDTLQQNVEEGQTAVTQAAATMPSFRYGGYTYRSPGASASGGPQPINLEDAFHSGSDALAAFDQGFQGLTPSGSKFRKSQAGPLDTTISPLGLDFSNIGSEAQSGLDRTRNALSKIIQRATLEPGSLVSRVDMPDTDLSALLSADIAGQGAASQGRVDAQRASLASAAPFLGGLEGVQRESRSLDFSEGATRAGQAVQSTANVRAQEADLEKFKAELQAQLGMKEVDINAMLAGQEAGGVTQLGLRGSQVPFEAGDLNLRTMMGERAIEEGNIGRQLDLFMKRLGLVGISGQEDTAKLMTALDLMLKQSGAVQGAAGTNLSADLGYGNLLSGAGLIGRNDVSWQNMINNLMTAWSANNANDQSQKSSFGGGAGGFSLGLGCVAGCMPVMTLTGPMAMKDTRLGTMVLGRDGKYHTVIHREYGKVRLEDRTYKHLLLMTEKSYIWITENHPLCGKPAGEWREGETLTWFNEDGNAEDAVITHVFPAPYVPSGDLYLDGGGEYMVMGFPVGSVIRPEGDCA